MQRIKYGVGVRVPKSGLDTTSGDPTYYPSSQHTVMDIRYPVGVTIPRRGLSSVKPKQGS